MAIDTIGTNALATGAVNTSKIASSAVDDSTIEIASNQLQLKDDGITNAKVNASAGIVTTKISGLDAQIDNGLGRLENEIGLLNVNRLIDNGAALDDFVKGFSDAFADETGVNTGANSNSIYSAANDTYGGSAITSVDTQIGANTALWQGNKTNWTFGFSNNDGNNYGMESNESSFGGNGRTTVRTVSAYDSTGDFLEVRLNNTSSIGGMIGVVDQNYASHIPGDTTANYYAAGIFSGSSHWFNGSPITAGVKAAALWFSAGNIYAFNITGTSSSAVSISAGASGTAITLGIDPTTRNLYAKLNGTLNTTLNNHWASGTNNKSIDDDYYIISNATGEGGNIDFDYVQLSQSFGDASSSSTFQTAAQTATAQPDTVRLVLLGKEEQSQTINTDTVWSISRDGGTTFSAITMTQSGNYNSSGVKIYTGTVDVSGQPAGTSIVLKQTTTATKGFTLHGYSLLYK